MDVRPSRDEAIDNLNDGSTEMRTSNEGIRMLTKNPFANWLAGGLCLLAVGCSTFGDTWNGPSAKRIDAAMLEQMRPGQTTEQEVLAIFGEPGMRLTYRPALIKTRAGKKHAIGRILGFSAAQSETITGPGFRGRITRSNIFLSVFIERGKVAFYYVRHSQGKGRGPLHNIPDNYADKRKGDAWPNSKCDQKLYSLRNNSQTHWFEHMEPCSWERAK